MSRIIVYYPGPVSQEFVDSLPHTRLEAWLREIPILARILRFVATILVSVTQTVLHLALACFNRSIAACPASGSTMTVGRLHLDAGRCAIRIGDLESAENHLRAAIESFCSLPPTHLAVMNAAHQLVDVMSKRGRRTQALQFIQHLLAETKLTPRPHPVAIELESLAQSLS